MQFSERIAKKLEKHGEAFTVNGHTYRGVFRILDSGTMRAYLDDVEVMAVTHPGLLLVTVPDAEINQYDHINRDNRDYVVFKSSLHRIGDVSVVKLVILV